MKKEIRRIGVWIAAGVVGLFLSSTWIAGAHCDTMSGPVITDAKLALEKGDVTPVLKWVKQEHEQEIKDAFHKALEAENEAPDSKEKAEISFFETLVRVHREGEGAPFTGLKSTPVESVMAMADKALEIGSADEMINRISAHVAAGMRERFDKVVEAKKRVNDSVAAGREYVEAYVNYVHYIEGVHSAIMSSGGHHEGGNKTAEREEHHAE